VVAPYVKDDVTVAYTDACDAKKIIGSSTQTRQDGVLEKFWTLMTAEQIRHVEKYVDEDGVERFELTEILSDLLTLI
jgi:putative ATP-dependent endonuclease of OLD family